VAPVARVRLSRRKQVTESLSVESRVGRCTNGVFSVRQRGTRGIVGKARKHVPAGGVLVLQAKSRGQIINAGFSLVGAVALLADPEKSLPDDKLCQSGAILVLRHFPQLLAQGLEGGIVDGLGRLHSDRFVRFGAGGLRFTAWLTLRQRRGSESDQARCEKYLTDGRHRSLPVVGRARSDASPRPVAQSTTIGRRAKNMRSPETGSAGGTAGRGNIGDANATQQLTEQGVPIPQSRPDGDRVLACGRLSQRSAPSALLLPVLPHLREL